MLQLDLAKLRCRDGRRLTGFVGSRSWLRLCWVLEGFGEGGFRFRSMEGVPIVRQLELAVPDLLSSDWFVVTFIIMIKLFVSDTIWRGNWGWNGWSGRVLGK